MPCNSLIDLSPAHIHVQAARSGVEDVVIGMPHRGRLNVMANIVHKPVEQTIKEFHEEVCHLSSLISLCHVYCGHLF